MKYATLLTPLWLGLLMATVHAEEIRQDKFAMMDAAKDGAVVWEEFQAAHPDMKKEAFAVIDADGDGRVTREEWTNFMAGHRKSRTGGMGGGMGMPAGSEGKEGGHTFQPPLIVPPAPVVRPAP